MIFWRGAGWSVPLILFAWLFVLIGFMIATLGPEPDPNADANTHRLFSLAFALAAATVYWVASRRERRRATATDPERSPGPDDFMFIKMRYWTYVYAGAASYFLIKSFLS